MKEQEKKIVYAYDERNYVVQCIRDAMHTHHIFAFVGPLGAGKTTIIRDVLRSFGVKEPITSPTFTYVNEYETDDNKKIYHFDLYRIGSVEEFQEQGFEEYLHQLQAWTFIEWPEVIAPLLQENVCWLMFDYHEDSDKRIVIIRCV